MKNSTVNADFIWNKWAVEKLSFADIALLDIPSNVGLKRIRNIVYAGRGRCVSDWEREVCRRFRVKFMELQDVPATILWVCDNQPAVRITERTVRNVINSRLKHCRV